MAERDLQSTDWRLESLWKLGLLSAVFVHLHLTFSEALREEFWADELIRTMMWDGSLASAIFTQDGHIKYSTIPFWLALKILPSSPLGLRLLPLMYGLSTVVLVAFVGKRIEAPWSGLSAAWMMNIDFLSLRIHTEYADYAQEQFLVIAIVFVSIGIVQRSADSRRHLFSFWILGALLMSSRPTTATVMIVCIVWLAIDSRLWVEAGNGRRAMMRIDSILRTRFGILVTPVLGIGALLVLGYLVNSVDTRVGVAPPDGALVTLFSGWFTSGWLGTDRYAQFLFFVGLICSIPCLIILRNRAETSYWTLILFSATTPIISLYLISSQMGFGWMERYLVSIHPMVNLLISGSIIGSISGLVEFVGVRIKPNDGNLAEVGSAFGFTIILMVQLMILSGTIVPGLAEPHRAEYGKALTFAVESYDNDTLVLSNPNHYYWARASEINDIDDDGLVIHHSDWHPRDLLENEAVANCVNDPNVRRIMYISAEYDHTSEAYHLVKMLSEHRDIVDQWDGYRVSVIVFGEKTGNSTENCDIW